MGGEFGADAMARFPSLREPLTAVFLSLLAGRNVVTELTFPTVLLPRASTAPPPDTPDRYASVDRRRSR